MKRKGKQGTLTTNTTVTATTDSLRTNTTTISKPRDTLPCLSVLSYHSADSDSELLSQRVISVMTKINEAYHRNRAWVKLVRDFTVSIQDSFSEVTGMVNPLFFSLIV